MKRKEKEETAPRRKLCTPDDFARTSLLYVQEIGELAPTRPMTSRRAGFPSLLFLLAEWGEGVVREGSEERPLRAGECALLDCRRGCGHATGEPPWRLKWIHFDGPSAHSFLARWRERAGGPVLRATSPEGYRRVWEDVWAAVSSADPVRDLRASEGLASLCTMLMADAIGTEPDRRAERLAAVRSWIGSHCAEAITLDRLAGVAHLNKFTLSREFRARYGVPPSRAIAQARVDRAKRLLRFTDDTVEAVGAAVGVPDPNYFARLFRRVEGLSPRAFRDRWRE